MTVLTNPLWNSMGVIPPVDTNDPTGDSRSPYEMDIIQFIRMFGLTPARMRILKGFLEFRAQLTSVGITDGFQWIDGSFTEHIELTEKRPPNDVDVVTFFNFQLGDRDEDVYKRCPELFDQPKVKQKYLVDSYFESLQTPGQQLVNRTVYWYSMWAHKRDLSWKGFIQVPLSPALDSKAVSILDSTVIEGA